MKRVTEPERIRLYPEDAERASRIVETIGGRRAPLLREAVKRGLGVIARELAATAGGDASSAAAVGEPEGEA